ncbi:MAG: PAS domain S-box protein [Paludibacter sp.]
MDADNLKTEVLLELIFCVESKETDDEVINGFLPIYIRKLNCFMAGVIRNSNSELIEKQVYPVVFKKDETWEYLKNTIVGFENNKSEAHSELKYKENFYYVYYLSQYGFLILGRKKPFEHVFKNEFRFVVNFLGKILSQSIEDILRKKAEKKLAEERQLLRTIIDNIPINIYAKDLEYKKTLANISELKHLGKKSESEVLGKSDLDLYGEEISKNTIIEDEQVILHGNPILGVEKHVGNDNWALISKLPLKNELGEVTGMVGISIDYTERKKTQEQLSVFLNLFDNISDAVQVNTEDGQLFYLNKMASERLGIPVDKVANFKVTDYLVIFPTMEAWKKHVGELKIKDFITSEGVNLNQKTGQKFPVEVTVKYVDVNGKGFVVAISRDISERKQAELALQVSEEKFRLMTENSSDVIWHLDSNYICDYISPADEQMRGYKQEEAVGKPLWNLLKPEGIEQVKIINSQRLADEQLGIKTGTIHYELEQLCKDGSWIWTEANSSVHYNENGEVIGYHGVTRDITERKKAEEELRWNQSLLQLMSNSSPLGFLVVDNRTDAILYFNQQFCQIWGIENLADRMRLGELKNNDIIPYCLPVLSDVEAFAESCKPLQAENNRVVLEDDIAFTQGRTVHRFTTQIRGENDEYFGRFYIFEDITKRKQIEVELQTNEKKYRQITENMLDIVWTSDMHFNLNFLSPSAEKLYGEPIERQIRRPLNEKFTPKSLEKILSEFSVEMENEKNPATDKNRTLKLEVEHYRADKSTFWAEINMSILRDEFGVATGIQGVTRDISDRKQAEDALKKSEERKASLIASMNDIVYVLDNDLILNEYHMPQSGELILDPKPYLGRPFDDIPLPLHAKSIIKKALLFCIQSRKFTKVEYYLDTPKTRFWFELHATVLNDQNGVQSGTTCIIRDITYRKQREEVIKQQVKMQEILIKISSVYININLEEVESTIQSSLKELGEFVSADRAYIYDYDFVNNTTSNTYEWCAAGVEPEIDIAQDIPLEGIPFSLGKHLKGEELHIDNVSALPDEGPESIKSKLEPQGLKSVISIPMMSSGKLLGFVGFDSVKEYHTYSEKEKNLLEVFSQMLVNVRERKRSGTLLMLQEEKYRNIISNMNLGIIEVDNDENIMYANQSFCNISGYSNKELLSMKTLTFLNSSDDKLLLDSKLNNRKKGLSDSYELAVKNKNGEQRWWFVSGAPNYNDNNELVGSIGIHLDITNQKKLEKELEQAIIVAENASKAKEVFLANMSHEIRTPLNVITGMVRELGKENLTTRQKSFVNHSETAAYHLLTIINNILDMSKIEAGEFELDNKDFSISAVASDVWSILYSKAKEKNLELRILESPEIHRSLIGDAGRLRQILINLIGNALKFTELGFVELKISVKNSNKYFQRLLFEVNDSGIGMSEEFLHKLFDKFSQEDGNFNRRFEGTGLGMSISKELVQLMGGIVVAKSQKGMGTQISFELNLPIGDESKLVDKNTIKVEPNCFEGIKVLLVEDNEMNRFIAIQSLHYVGCKVTEAENGLEAIKQLKENEFDLVLMDIQMPEMDGVEATKQIRNTLGKQIPIIALTANAFKHDIDLYLSVGMNDYLIKPYREEDLYRKIEMYTKSIQSAEIENIQPLYDLNDLEVISRGDKSFINKMLEVFVNASQQAISQFTADYENNNIDGIRKLAHKLKPSIDNMGVISLKDKIRILERFELDHNEEVELNVLVLDVCTILQQVCDEIRRKEDL